MRPYFDSSKNFYSVPTRSFLFAFSFRFGWWTRFGFAREFRAFLFRFVASKMGGGKKKKNKKHSTDPKTSNNEDKKEVPKKIDQKKEVLPFSSEELAQSSKQDAGSYVPDDWCTDSLYAEDERNGPEPENSTISQTSNNEDKNEVKKKKEPHFSSSKEIAQLSKQGAGSDVPADREMGRLVEQGQRKGPEPEKSYSDYDFKNNKQKKFSGSRKTLEAVSDQFRFIDVEGDLFDSRQEYALAHCVASDFKMGAGVALEFRKQFASVGSLLDQNVRVGGVAFIQKKDRYIYYLVTKKVSSGKPTYDSLRTSLVELCRQMQGHNVKKLAIPELGCGLDLLDWDRVKKIICEVFANSDVEIKAYHYRSNAAKRNHRRIQPSSEEQSYSNRGQMKITDYIHGEKDWRRHDNKYEQSTKNPENHKKQRDLESTNDPMKRLKLDSETTAHPTDCTLEIKTGNMFHAPWDYSLAYFVTPDFDMSKGIALKYRYPYRKIGELLDQRITVGGVAHVEIKNRLNYYLVITFDEETPNYDTLRKSLMSLKDLMKKHKVNKFAMPCMDQLYRPEFTKMIKEIFASTGVQILIYTSEGYGEATVSVPRRSAYIVESPKSLVEMERETARLYICSVTDDITEDMKLLDKRFPFLNEYNKTQRRLGHIVRVETPRQLDYTYGLICRRSPKDPVQFEMLENCMHEFARFNNKDKYVYLGIQDIVERGNDILKDQVLNIMKYSTRPPVAEIYVCKPHN